MVGQVIFPIRPCNNAVVPGSQHFSRHRLQNARPCFVPRIGIRPQHMIRYCVIHPVSVRLPAPSAVETVIAFLMFYHARPFQRVPIVDAAIHGPLGHESLPVIAGAQHHTRFARHLVHCCKPIHHERRSRPNASVRIEKIARVEQIPCSVVIAKRVRIDCER